MRERELNKGERERCERGRKGGRELNEIAD